MPLQNPTMGDYQTQRTLETFGFLPPMTQDEIYDQISYILAQGWTPAIEHVHPSQAGDDYWTMWKLSSVPRSWLTWSPSWRLATAPTRVTTCA